MDDVNDIRVVTTELLIEREPVRTRALAQAEGELAPPSSMPPILELLNVNAGAAASGSPLDGRLLVEGTVSVSVLYLAESGEVFAFESSAAFSHTVELDATPQCRAEVNATVGAIETQVADGALRVKAVVELDCCVCARVLAPVAERLEGEAQQRFLPVTVELIEECAEEYTLREDVRLPRAARAMMAIHGCARVERVVLDAARATVEGFVKGWASFCTNDGELIQTPVSLRFEQRIPLPDGACRAYADAVVTRISAELLADDIAHAECELKIRLKAVCEQRHELLDDAYCPGGQLVLQRAALAALRRTPLSAQLPVRLTADVPASLPSVDRVLLCSCRAQLEEAEAKEGCVALKGTVLAYITYRCPAGKLHGFGCKLPFATAFDAAVTPGMPVCLRMACDCSGSGTGRQLSLQINASVCGEAYAATELSVVTDAAFSPGPTAFSGVAVYYPARGETLWDVGKRFGVSQERLLTLNADASCNKPLIVSSAC